MLTPLLIGLLLGSLKIGETSASPTVRVYVSMPDSHIPGKPVEQCLTSTYTSRAPSEERTLTFTWDTSRVSEGVYIIKAVAATVPEETDVEDNTFIDDTVTVVSPPPVEGWVLLATDPDEGTGTNLKEIYGNVDSGILYFKVVHYRPWTTIYEIDTGISLDTDRDPTTGLPDGLYPNQNTGIGADYVIVVGWQGTEMWRWDETTEWWDLDNPIALAYLYGSEDTNVFVVGVYLSDVHLLTEAIDGAVADVKSSWDWMPDTGYFTYQLIPAITATVDIHPETLNLKSKGRWITCYIELPENYSVSDIDVSTIMLNDTIPAEWGNVQNTRMMVKFDRAEVIRYIRDAQGIKYGDVTLTVTGELYDGPIFEGSGTIRARMPGDVNLDGKVNYQDLFILAIAYGSTPQRPYWYKDADLNGDNRVNYKDLFILAANYAKNYR